MSDRFEHVRFQREFAAMELSVEVGALLGTLREDDLYPSMVTEFHRDRLASALERYLAKNANVMALVNELSAA